MPPVNNYSGSSNRLELYYDNQMQKDLDIGEEFDGFEVPVKEKMQSSRQVDKWAIDS